MKRMGILTFLIILLVAIASGAVAAAESDQPGEIITDDGEIVGNDGEIVGNETDTQAITATSADDAESVQTTDTDVDIAVTVAPPGDSFSSDDTVDIWVGAFDDTGTTPVGLEDEELTVTITTPDGQTSDYDVETDADGAAHLEYDLAEEDGGDGTYEVTIEHPDVDDKPSIAFDVGPVVGVMNNRNTPVFVDEETTFSFLVRSGEYSVADESIEVSVTGPDGDLIADETLNTDDEGFAELSFVPDQTGSLTVSAELSDGSSADTQSTTVTEISMASDFDLRSGIIDESTVYGGYLRTPDGQLANTDIEVTFREDVFGEDGDIVLTEELTTDDAGFFLMDYELSSDLEEDRLDVEIETADGTPVAARFDTIWVDEVPEPDPDPEPDVSISANTDEFRTAPGSEFDIEIEALDADNEPIADESVDVFLQMEWDGPPLVSTTVTTDDDGTATETVSVPENIPDDVRLYGDVAFVYDDETYTDSFSIGVEKYDIWFDAGELVPGEEAEISIEAIETATDEPASGLPYQFAALYTNYKLGSYATGELVSGDDGTDSMTIDLPADLGPRESINDVNRYWSTGVNFIYVIDHPGEISLDTADETDWGDPIARPGEEIDVEFDTEDDDVAYGIVFGETFGPDGSFGTEITSDDGATLTVPEYADDGRLSLMLWAANEDGEFYADRIWLDVEDPEDVTAQFEFDPVEPTVGDTVTFDAAASDAETGIDRYEWDFDDGTTTETEEPVVEHEFDDSGAYSVSLTVVAEDESEDTVTQTVVVADDDDEAASISLRPSEASAEPEGETTLDVVVEGADSGISAYDLEITIADADVATIDDFEQMQDPDFDASEIREDGAVLRLEAGMGDNSYEADDEIVIATMTVEGIEEGETEILFDEGAAVSDQDVDQYELDAIEGATLEVAERDDPDPIVGEDPPQDLTGDGLYEDVTGDGEVTIFDVQALFSNLESDAVQENPAAFNFAGEEDPEEVTIFDVQAFFGQLDELQDAGAES